MLVFFFTYVNSRKKFFYCVLLLLPLFLTGVVEAAPPVLLPAADLLSCEDEELRLWLPADELPEVLEELEDCDLLELAELFFVLLLLLLDEDVDGDDVALAGIEFLYSLSARSSRARSLALS